MDNNLHNVYKAEFVIILFETIFTLKKVIQAMY